MPSPEEFSAGKPEKSEEAEKIQLLADSVLEILSGLENNSVGVGDGGFVDVSAALGRKLAEDTSLDKNPDLKSLLGFFQQAYLDCAMNGTGSDGLNRWMDNYVHDVEMQARTEGFDRFTDSDRIMALVIRILKADVSLGTRLDSK